MAEVTKENIYQGLKTLQSDISSVKMELHDVKLRMIRVNEGFDGISRGLDHVYVRFERLEHHLNFVDYPLP